MAKYTSNSIDHKNPVNPNNHFVLSRFPAATRTKPPLVVFPVAIPRPKGCCTAELERYLQAIPEVADAAVVPYPDEEAGQIPMAYIVRKPGSKINEAQIMEIIAKQVSPYKKIRKVAFINAIPKTPAGKILRRELVKHALSRASSKL